MKNLKQMPGAAMICRPHLAAFLPFRRHPAPGTLLVHLSDIAHPPVLAIPTCTHNGREFKGPPGQVLPPARACGRTECSPSFDGRISGSDRFRERQKTPRERIPCDCGKIDDSEQ